VSGLELHIDNRACWQPVQRFRCSQSSHLGIGGDEGDLQRRLRHHRHRFHGLVHDDSSHLPFVRYRVDYSGGINQRWIRPVSELSGLQLDRCTSGCCLLDHEFYQLQSGAIFQGGLVSLQLYGPDLFVKRSPLRILGAIYNNRDISHVVLGGDDGGFQVKGRGPRPRLLFHIHVDEGILPVVVSGSDRFDLVDH